MGRVGRIFCLLHEKQWGGWDFFFVYYMKNKGRMELFSEN